MSKDDGHKIMDLDAAAAKLGGDQALLSELAELFCNETPKLIDALRLALGTRDASAIRSAAHSLKGSLGVFAATHAANLAASLEDNAAAERLDLASDSVQELEAEVEKVRATLHNFVASQAVKIRAEIP
jgi:HPt (histidine-containing phosphotransfer) domain-containing protein